MTTASEKTADLLAEVLTELAPVVGGITDDQLHDLTPCTEYDVAQLREHVLGWLAIFAAGFADPAGQAPRAGTDGYQVPADPAAGVRAAASTIGQAIRPARPPATAARGQRHAGGHGAQHDPLGVPGTRLGPGPGHRPALVATHRRGRGVAGLRPGMLTSDYQGDGKAFGPRVPVPAAAAPLDRLLGLSGRDPGWTAR